MRITCLAFIAILAGCASQPQQGTAEVTFDGMTKLATGPFRESWADLDVDFPIQPGEETVVQLQLELLDAQGTVQWSGITDPISVSSATPSSGRCRRGYR